MNELLLLFMLFVLLLAGVAGFIRYPGRTPADP